jgi:hypothetical protein
LTKGDYSDNTSDPYNNEPVSGDGNIDLDSDNEPVNVVETEPEIIENNDTDS